MKKHTLSDLYCEFDSHITTPIVKKLPVCGLCGNSGIIDTTKTVSCLNQMCGVRAYCICPNGRDVKTKATKQKKWEGTSIIENKGE